MFDDPFGYPRAAFWTGVIVGAIQAVTLGIAYLTPLVREFVRRHWERYTLRRRYQGKVAARNRR